MKTIQFRWCCIDLLNSPSLCVRAIHRTSPGADPEAKCISRNAILAESVLLRSAESLAARHERKHQSTAATILPPRNRPVPHLSSAAPPSLAALESTSQKDIGFPNSCQ